MPPPEVMESAREEVRGVMMQYASCADPSESAARRERLRLAEAQGQLEASAAQIVRAAQTRNALCAESSTSPPMTSQTRIPASNRLGPLPELDNAPSPRVPVMERLGPLLDELIEDEATNASGMQPQQQKRKPGRPPGKRKVNASPLALMGSTSRRRMVQSSKPPNCRKKLTVDVAKTDKVTKSRKTKNAGPRVGIPREEEDNNSDNLPICNMVPKANRRRMDFRIQSNPAL